MDSTLRTPDDFKNRCRELLSPLCENHDWKEAGLTRDEASALDLRKDPYQIFFQSDILTLEVRATHHGFSVLFQFGITRPEDGVPELFTLQTLLDHLDPAARQLPGYPAEGCRDQIAQIEFWSSQLLHHAEALSSRPLEVLAQEQTRRLMEWASWCDQHYKQEEEIRYRAWGAMPWKYISEWKASRAEAPADADGEDGEPPAEEQASLPQQDAFRQKHAEEVSGSEA